MVIKDEILVNIPTRVVDIFHRWRDVLYNEVVFGMPESQLHSYAHTERVLLHALIVGFEIFGDDPVSLEILAHASLFHDTRRWDEYLDTGHGARGAVAYKQFCDSHEWCKYHPESAYLMRYHDLDDEIGIENIRKDFKDSSDHVISLYNVFKDADALDRWRLGSLGLDPRFLRTAPAKSAVDFARELVSKTMPPDLLSEIDAMVRRSMNNRE